MYRGMDNGKHRFVFGDPRLPVRFWQSIRVSSGGCWEWAGSKFGTGYGRYRHERGDRGRQLAHRVSYRVLAGEFDSGLDIDHLCRNKICVNPAHLEPVPHHVNQDRSPLIKVAFAARVEAQKAITHCPQGHEYTENNTRRDKRGCRVCRTCQRAAQKAYAAANRDKLSAAAEARRLADPELHRARCRASYHKHKGSKP